MARVERVKRVPRVERVGESLEQFAKREKHHSGKESYFGITFSIFSFFYKLMHVFYEFFS